jgi:hypothetical protein
MTRTLAILLLLASAPVPAVVPALGAQARTPRVVVPEPLMAIARNNLTFGNVLAGIPSIVEVHDVRRAGLFEIRGPADASVRVEFILPDALTSFAGDRLPLQFGARDGFADHSVTRLPGGIYFDPFTPLVASLGSGGRLFVHLGGQAQPARLQPGGEYRAVIYLTVYDLGS